MISVASFEVMKERILLMSTFMVILSTNLPPPPSPILPFSVGGVQPPTKFSKRAGLAGPQRWEGVAGKERGKCFQGGCNLKKKKKKLKSEIFNDNNSF